MISVMELPGKWLELVHKDVSNLPLCAIDPRFTVDEEFRDELTVIGFKA